MIGSPTQDMRLGALFAHPLLMAVAIPMPAVIKSDF
jgi:hypothetical protein